MDRIALIKRITSDWTPHLRQLVELLPPEAEATAIHLADWFPTMKREHERIVLMGDAAHTMTMCKLTLIASGDDLMQLITFYFVSSSWRRW